MLFWVVVFVEVIVFVEVVNDCFESNLFQCVCCMIDEGVVYFVVEIWNVDVVIKFKVVVDVVCVVLVKVLVQCFNECDFIRCFVIWYVRCMGYEFILRIVQIDRVVICSNDIGSCQVSNFVDDFDVIVRYREVEIEFVELRLFEDDIISECFRSFSFQVWVRIVGDLSW